MKQKILLSLITSSLLSLPILANAYCPFTDYFALSIASGGKIMDNVRVDGNLTYDQQTETFFTLSCGKDKIKPGTVTMKIGFNEKNVCEIVLYDGPYVVNPSVTTVNCEGNLYFNGIDHFTGSHNYTLKFSS